MPGRARRFDARPTLCRQRGAEGRARLRAELGKGDHVWIMGDDRVHNTGGAGATALLDVPGKDLHLTPNGSTRRSTLMWCPALKSANTVRTWPRSSRRMGAT
jgi:hypothetical protein